MRINYIDLFNQIVFKEKPKPRSVLCNSVIDVRVNGISETLFRFVGYGNGDCVVNIDRYLIVPLERVLGADHAREDKPGFLEKVFISLGIYVIDVRDHLSAYRRFKRFFRYWFASQNG